MSGCGNVDCVTGIVPILDGRVLPGRAGPMLCPTGKVAVCPICDGTGDPAHYKEWTIKQRSKAGLE